MKAVRKRIMYGFQGDGRGHLSRAEALVRELAKHHDILVLTTGTGKQNLSPELRNLPGVTVSGNIFSPKLYFSGNRINISKTLLFSVFDIVRKAVPSFLRGLRIYWNYRPDLIISDLEPFSAWLAWFTGARFMSFDHQHVLTDCEIEFPREFRKDYLNAKLMVRFLVPVNRLNAITSFFFPRIKTDRTRVFKPLLRREILAAKGEAVEGEFVLIYQTSSATLEMLDKVLKPIKSQSFVVYNKEREYRDGNIVYKGIAVDGFIKDLAACKAVLCNGGYLISEALFLGKPVLSVPIINSFDQILNSLYLDKLGYGQFSRHLSAAEIRRFLQNIYTFKRKIRENEFFGNQEIVDFILSTIG